MIITRGMTGQSSVIIKIPFIPFMLGHSTREVLESLTNIRERATRARNFIDEFGFFGRWGGIFSFGKQNIIKGVPVSKGNTDLTIEFFYNFADDNAALTYKRKTIIFLTAYVVFRDDTTIKVKDRRNKMTRIAVIAQ